jgi:hypothetical protein
LSSTEIIVYRSKDFSAHPVLPFDPESCSLSATIIFQLSGLIKPPFVSRENGDRDAGLNKRWTEVMNDPLLQGLS